MRYAALAFGVLAGLVASLILALGGLDPAMLPHFDPRQEAIIRFGLFVVANIGVLGAGIVLAVPLAGAVLFVIGAIAWIVAAVMLRHGPDYVLITPPVLLLIAFGFGLATFLLRRRTARDEYYDDERVRPIRAAMADQEADGEEDDDERRSDEEQEEDEDEEQPAGTRVSAGFFGQHGTAMPARVEAGAPSQPALRSAFDDDGSERWRPGSRKPPPRQQPMFRDIEDDYDDEEESGFARFARGFSGVASFGLYAALAGAAVLIFWNLRAGETAKPSAATVDAKSSIVATASSAAVAPPPAAPVLSSAPPAPQIVAAAEPSSLPPTNLITAAPTLDNAPLVAPGPATLDAPAPGDPDVPGSLTAEATPPPVTPSLASLTPPATDASPLVPPTTSSEESPAPGPTIGTADNPMPFPMLPEMAAERAKPAPRPPAPAAATTPTTPRRTAPAAPQGDAGL